MQRSHSVLFSIFKILKAASDIFSNTLATTTFSICLSHCLLSYSQNHFLNFLYSDEESSDTESFVESGTERTRMRYRRFGRNEDGTMKSATQEALPRRTNAGLKNPSNKKIVPGKFVYLNCGIAHACFILYFRLTLYIPCKKFIALLPPCCL